MVSWFLAGMPKLFSWQKTVFSASSAGQLNSHMNIQDLKIRTMKLSEENIEVYLHDFGIWQGILRKPKELSNKRKKHINWTLLKLRTFVLQRIPSEE